MKDKKQKDPILSAMETETPSESVLNKARAEMSLHADENKKAKNKKVFYKVALSVAPILVLTVIIAVLSTQLFPNGFGCASADKSFEDALNGSANHAPWDGGSGASSDASESYGFWFGTVTNTPVLPENFKTYEDSESGIILRYWETESRVWVAYYTDLEENIYIIQGRGSEADLILFFVSLI